MVNETVENDPLETLAQKIAQYANEAEERTIEAAKLIRVLRSRIENGEAGPVTWYSWARKNIQLSMSRLRELQSIAVAEDPRTELERIRRKTQARVQRHRERKRSAPLRNGGATVQVTAEMEEDRKHLIEWAQSAPLKHVTAVLSHVRRLDPAAAVANPNWRPGLVA
jgi:hypothetical protein